MCVSRAVMLPTIVLHKTSAVPPYKRGFYCSDDSIRYTFKSSTVPSSVLVAVGLLLPTVSVSRPHTHATPAAPRPPQLGTGRDQERVERERSEMSSDMPQQR